MQDMNEEKYSEERTRLIAQGIPEHVVEYTLSLEPSRQIYRLLSFLLLLLLVSGLIVGVFLWGYYENMLDKNALAAAEEVNAFLYFHNFGIAGLIGIFFWIFAAGAILYGFHYFSEKFRASIFVYTYLDPKNAPYLALLKVKEPEPETTPREFLKRAVNRWMRITLWPAIILGLLVFTVLERELNTYTLYTEEGLIAKPLFHWESDKLLSWNQAQFVELGCQHAKGRTTTNDVVYRVTFNDGSSKDPGTTFPVYDSLLDGLERIDRILLDNNTEIRRWKRRMRNPLHPECLDFYREKYSPEEYDRLITLLRINELSTG